MISIWDFLKRSSEHNEHALSFNIRGVEWHPCARCTGKIMGIFAMLPIALLIVLGYAKLDIGLLTGFVMAWSLALPAIIDWSTVKANIRKGSNKVRFVTGFALGMGLVVYFLLMPASLLFKVVTFFAYELVFAVIYIHVHYQMSIFDYIGELTAKPMMYSCECGTSCTCCGGAGDCLGCNNCIGNAINACTCICLACITIPIFFCCIGGCRKNPLKGKMKKGCI